MWIIPDCRRLRAAYLVAALFLCLGPARQQALAHNPAASEADIQRTAGLVRFASTFCGTSELTVQTYKAALRRSAALSSEFDTTWNFGWSSEEDLIIQYLNLRWSDPNDFASRVRADCGLVRKQIQPGVEIRDDGPKSLRRDAWQIADRSSTGYGCRTVVLI